MKNTPFDPNLTRAEGRWGIRYLLFELVFLAPLLKILLDFLFPEATTVHLNFLYFLVNFIVVLCLFRSFLLISFKKTLKDIPRCLATALGGFVVYEAMSIGLGMLIRWAFSEFFNVNDAALNLATRSNFLLMSIGTVILVPIVEETLHRGLVFGLFRSQNRWLGYIISVLLFCSIHVSGYIGLFDPLHLLICFIQYIPAGVVLAWTYEFTGSIFVPTAIHMAVNAIALLSMR